MTHIDMSQSAWSYFRARRYDPFPILFGLINTCLIDTTKVIFWTYLDLSPLVF